MKKKLGMFIMLLGVGADLTYCSDTLKYGDIVYIKNVVINKYAINDGGILVGKKEVSEQGAFKLIPELKKDMKKEIRYGDYIYFQSTTAKSPMFIGDSGEKYRIYGMKRTLLGMVPIAEKDKIYKFCIWPAEGTKKAKELKEEFNKTEMVTRKPISYGEEINIHREPSKKSFRFNTDLSTYKFGTEVFISDDSKLMTPKARKDTKKLILQKVGK